VNVDIAGWYRGSHRRGKVDISARSLSFGGARVRLHPHRRHGDHRAWAQGVAQCHDHYPTGNAYYAFV